MPFTPLSPAVQLAAAQPAPVPPPASGGASTASHDMGHDRAVIDALAGLQLLGGLDELIRPSYEGVLSLGALALRQPVAMLLACEQDGLRMMAASGLPALRPMPKDGPSLWVSQQGQSLVVPDLLADERFVHSHAATQALWRFYAGVPMLTDTGQAAGVVCVLGPEPAPPLDAQDLSVLHALAAAMARALKTRAARLNQQAERELLVSGPMAGVMWQPSAGWPIRYRSSNLPQVIGSAAVAALDRGSAFDTLVHPQDRSQFRVALHSHVRSALERVELSYRISLPGGGQRWIRQTSVSRRNPEGGLTLIQGYLLDDTRHKQLEADIRNTQERLFLALESAQLGSWDSDLRSGEHRCSPRVPAMLGLRPDELGDTTQDWLDRVHPFDRAVANDLYLVNNSGPDDINAVYRARHRDGSYRWLQCFAHVVARDETGLVARMTGTLRDITEQQQQSLQREQQSQLLAMLNDAQNTFLVGRELEPVCLGLLPPLLALCQCRFGFIGIVQAGTGGAGWLWLPALAGLPASHGAAAGLTPDAPGLLETGRTLLAPVLAQGQPLKLLAPAPAAQWPAGLPRPDNLLALPICQGQQVLGMVGLGQWDEGIDDAVVVQLAPLLTGLSALLGAWRLDLARQAAEAELHSRAGTDGQTGLASRNAFMSAVGGALLRAGQSGQPLTLAVLCLQHPVATDLERQVNQLSALALAVLDDRDIVGRLSAGRLAVLMPDTEAPAAQATLQRLHRAMVAANAGQGATPALRLGLAVWPDPLPPPPPAANLPLPDPAENLLERAVLALQQAGVDAPPAPTTDTR